MAEQDNIELVQRVLAAFRNDDIEGLMECAA